MLTLFFAYLFTNLVEGSIIGSAHNDGPNCMNGALNYSHLVYGHRYSSQSEVEIILKSPLCEKSDQSFGAIGLVYSESPFANKSIISHAFIVLDDGIAYEKRGYGKSEPYQTTTLENIFNDYDLQEPLKSVQYFKCLPITKLISSPTLHPALKEKLNHFNRIDQKIDSFKELNAKEVATIKEMIQIELTNFNPNEFLSNDTNRLAIKIIASRVVSIAGQMNAVGDESLRKLTFDFEYTSENIERLFDRLNLQNPKF